MAEIWGAISAAAAVGGLGLGIAQASRGQPGAPDYAGTTAAGIRADAETLADRRRMERAARLGIDLGEVETGPPQYRNVQTEQVNLWEEGIRPKAVRGADGKLDFRATLQGIPAGGWVPYVEEDWLPGGKYYQEGKGLPTNRKTVNELKWDVGTTQADFTGLGDADIQGAQAEEMAAGLLQFQKDYAPRFIEAARREREIADPEGVAAEKKLADLIQQDAKNADMAQRPIADELDRQLTEDMAAGGRLTDEQDARLRRSLVESQLTRGDTTLDPSALKEWLNTQDLQREINRQQRSTASLTSGTTPEDVRYRRNQQVLSNMGAFRRGETPVAQFASLSGAQTGAAPFRPGQPLVGANPQAGAQAAQGALSQYGQVSNEAANSANPWTAALGFALQGANIAAGAGWKPFGAS